MMSLTIILAAFVSSCSAGAVVRHNKGNKAAAHLAAKIESTDSAGFDGAEDVPTAAAHKVAIVQTAMNLDKKTTIRAQSGMTSVTVGKAGATGPTFHNSGEDTHAEHPNIVDKFAYAEASIQEELNDGSNIPMFLFLACGAGAVAWMYTSDQNRNQAKDKAGAVMSMLGPLVQDAAGAIGVVMQTANAASDAAQNASRKLQKPARSDDHDELLAEEVLEKDQFDPTAGIESSFFDEDESPAEEAPALMETPALDLFDTSAPLPPLDLFADPVLSEFGVPSTEPQTLESLGLSEFD